MTKHRPPLSFDAALARIVGQLPGGYEDAAKVANRAVSTIRNWGIPDRDEVVPIDCALALDVAYRGAGGIGAPFLEAFTAQLEKALSNRFAGADELLLLLPEVLRENSEAEVAIVTAAKAQAGSRDYRETLREIDEAMGRFQQARQLVQSLLTQEQHVTAPP
jgi:hypothetical protein